MIERIDHLNETRIHGYFETVESTFLLKFLLILIHTRNAPEGPTIDPRTISQSWLAELMKVFPNERTFTECVRSETLELHENLMDDLVTAALSSAWIVFEHVIKDLPNPNYAHLTETLDAVYQRNEFGFSAQEKKDLEFFYYLRNALQHYNGAYFAYRSIDHVYRGHHFQSKGHEGEHMVISPGLSYQILVDMERYSCKAWTHFMALHS